MATARKQTIRGYRRKQQDFAAVKPCEKELIFVALDFLYIMRSPNYLSLNPYFYGKNQLMTLLKHILFYKNNFFLIQFSEMII